MKLLLPNSLPNKLAASVALLLCIGLIPLVYFTGNVLQNRLEKQLTDHQFAYTNFVASDLENKIQLRIQSLQDIADSLPTHNMHDATAINAYLATRRAIYRLFANGVVVIGLDGWSIADYPKIKSRRHADFNELEYFKEVVATGRVAIGKPRVGRFTKKLGLGIAVPIKNKHGKLVGVMVGFIGLTDPSVFNQSQAKIGRSGEYVLVSVQDRVIVMDSDNSHNLQPVALPGKDPELDRFMSGKEGTAITHSIHGGKSLTSAKSILDGRWVLFAVLPIEEAFAPIHNLQKQVLITGVIIVLIVVGLVWLLMRIELKPLTVAERLISNMTHVGNKLHEVPVTTNDEIGRLLTSFNHLQRDLQESYKKIEQQAHVDYLTGLSNRRYFLELAEQEISRATRYKSSLAVCMLDVDYFKKVNDTYGHKVGDILLQKLSELFNESLRNIDIVGRIGGEEFAILLPETDSVHAIEVAERLRKLVEGTKITLETGLPLKFTVSIGIAMFDGKGENIDTLLNSADQALYQAKSSGRNKVCMNELEVPAIL